MYSIFEMENTTKYIVHVLPLPQNTFTGENTPYAVTIEGKDSPIVHVNNRGQILKKQSWRDVGSVVSSTPQGDDLSLIVREFFPKGTKHEDIYHMLHG